MANIFDFGFKEYKIKMDGNNFTGGYFAVMGDTARRVEVRLLGTDNVVRDTSGLRLQLWADAGGKVSYVEGEAVEPEKGKYRFDLINGLLLSPGVQKFQWRIIDSDGRTLNSVQFKGAVGNNLEGDAWEDVHQLYLNTGQLKKEVNEVRGLQKDLIDGAVDSAAIQRNVEERYTNLEAEYAEDLSTLKRSDENLSAQLAQTVKQGQNESITKAMLSQEIKSDLNNGEIDFRLNTSEIEDGAITPEKLNNDVGLYEKFYPTFVLGEVGVTTGLFYNSRNAFSFNYYIPHYKGDVVEFYGGTDGLRMQIHYYDTNKKYLGPSPMYLQQSDTRTFISDTDGFIRIVVDLSVSGEIPEDKYDLFVKPVGVIANRLKTVSVLGSTSSSSSGDGNSLLNETIRIPLEAHGIYKDTGTNISNRDLTGSEDFTVSQRTGKYLKVIPSTNFKLNFTNGRAYVFQYKDDFQFLSQSEVINGQDYVLQPETKLIKILIEDLTVDNPNVVLEYSVKSKGDKWVYNDDRTNRPGSSHEYVSFVYETASNEGRSVPNPDGTEKQFSNIRYFNSGILMLPPNYDPYGEPIKLIIWCPGSGGFLTFNSHLIDGYSSYFQYLLDEGYAIMGVYKRTTKYNVSDWDIGLTYAMPTSTIAITQGYKYVISNYNIDKSGVFVSGKSSGGFDSNNLSYHKSVPVLATGLFAPTFNALLSPYGSYEGSRYIVAEDFGFEGDHSVLANNGDLPTVKRTPELRGYMVQNAHKMTGYNPLTNGLINGDAEEIARRAYDGTLYVDDEFNRGLKRLYPNPIKIWYSMDDDRAGIPQQLPWFFKSIWNVNGNAEERLMPVGTGGHNSVDSDPRALKVDKIETKLGIEHTNVPLAYVELVSYFRRFEN